MCSVLSFEAIAAVYVYIQFQIFLKSSFSDIPVFSEFIYSGRLCTNHWPRDA